jgi:cellulose synthase/poly-beta-1,6-N-acetylglucosamine synthase-like glycosyltransferase
MGFVDIVLSVLTLCVVGYSVSLFIAGTRPTEPVFAVAPDLRFVILIPCLNEELVIGRTIERLLGLTTKRPVTIMVIDDGSDDSTAAVVNSYASERVVLFQRVAPNARQGKGEALNAAYRQLREESRNRGERPEDLIVAVLDADGRLDPNAIDVVAPYFADRRTAALQIRVTIHNARDGLLARMQDIEFATFTEIYQRARARFGSAGMGGNGQFARLAALEDLGDAPWSDCLTEDLELGMEFLLHGWRNAYTPDTWVSQQGVTKPGALVRQRARWFQGHLQCLRYVPKLLRSRLPILPRLDLSFHLINSLLLLVLQSFSVLWIASVGVLLALQPTVAGTAIFGGWRWIGLYVLAFGMAPFVALIYKRSGPGVGTLRALFYGHCYVLYGYLWYAAGLRAVYRQLAGRQGWAKTARTVGTGDEAPVIAGTPVPALAAHEDVIDLRDPADLDTEALPQRIPVSA